MSNKLKFRNFVWGREINEIIVNEIIKINLNL